MISEHDNGRDNPFAFNWTHSVVEGEENVLKSYRRPQTAKSSGFHAEWRYYNSWIEKEHLPSNYSFHPSISFYLSNSGVTGDLSPSAVVEREAGRTLDNPITGLTAQTHTINVLFESALLKHRWLLQWICAVPISHSHSTFLYYSLQWIDSSWHLD